MLRGTRIFFFKSQDTSSRDQVGVCCSRRTPTRPTPTDVVRSSSSSLPVSSPTPAPSLQIAGHIDLPAGTRASAGESKKKAYTFAIATTSGDHIFRVGCSPQKQQLHNSPQTRAPTNRPLLPQVPTLTEREIWLDAILKAVTDAKRLRAGLVSGVVCRFE